MSITRDSLETIVTKLKKHSAKDTTAEIMFWEAYSLHQAYDSFWSRQYLDLYIYQLDNIVELYNGQTLTDNNYITDQDVLNIFNKSKELLFYLTKTPYELLS